MASSAGSLAATGVVAPQGRHGARLLAWLASLSMLEKWALVAIAAGSIARLAVFQDRPLWFDETFTAVIATQTSYGKLLSWMLMELGGPVYYLTAWCWEAVAGESNTALRLPSLVFSFAAVAVAATTRTLDRTQGLVFAAMLALLPSAYYDTANARSYSMLVLLAVVQLLAFIRLLRDPKLANACMWTGLSTLAILTHYHFAVLCLVQGLIYLGVHRMAAVRTWPSMLLVVPAFAWGAAQYDFLSTYARPGNNWYTRLEVVQLLLVPPMLLPFGKLAYPLALGAAIGAGARIARALGAARQRLTAEQWAALAGVGATALLLAVGMIVPSFTGRYVIPYMPAVSLGVALWLVRMARNLPRIAGYALLMLCVNSMAAAYHLAVSTDNRWNNFNFQVASDWIMDSGAAPQRVVFFWDNPTGDISIPKYMKEVGGYFFRRAGQHPDIVIPRGVGPDTDPNQMLPRLAGADGKGAFIWLADKAVRGTRAIRYPESFSGDPSWRCHRYGTDAMVMLACVPAR